MKIVHICLACFYVDKMAYQENLLPKYHAENHDVVILTSDYSFNSYGEYEYKQKQEYYNEHGIQVKVLKKSNRYGPYSRYNDFDGVFEALNKLVPDIIFCHGGQFVALKDVLKYCKKNRSVKLFIDQHGDYYNAPISSLKNKIVQRYIYGYWIRRAVPRTELFWGVTPWRCQYLHEVYGVPKNKIDLLVMGGDDDKIDFQNQHNIRINIRKRYHIDDNSFLIVTGGKIDEAKNIHHLVEAVKELKNKNVSLLIFGQPSKEFENTFSSLIEEEDNIKYIGWIPSDQVYNFFLSADFAVFPGTHSVLWEQACACGLPGLFKDWEGMHHVDVCGNAVFLDEITVEKIAKNICDIIDNRSIYEKMKDAAMKGRLEFSYREISKKAIGERNDT